MKEKMSIMNFLESIAKIESRMKKMMRKKDRQDQLEINLIKCD